MTPAELEIAHWLDTIDDADRKAAIAAAFEIATRCEPEAEDDEVFAPFVYPH